jgi:hypothetical protein
MNKRIRRKVHKHYLVDVVYEISTSSAWRQKLFKADYGTKFTITYHRTDKVDIPQSLYRVLCRYKLKYLVSKVSLAEAVGWENYENCIIFKFQSAEFSDIHSYSANNPEIV